MSKRILVSLALFAALVFTLAASAAPTPSVVYNAIPSTLPPNMASLGFQATQTSEFGDYVHLAGTDRLLKTVTVTMSDWALASDYPALPAGGWTHPITVNLYNAVPGTPLNTVGSLVGSATQTFTIPWRPAGPVCPTDASAWMASDGQCYHGFAFNITFDLSSQNITLPDDVIVGIAYNTQSYGSAPIGVGGPYDSLNVGVEGSTTVGTDDNTDNVFWNTSTAAGYTDGGAGGVGIFREDTGWGGLGYGTIPLQITASASPVGPPTSKDQCKGDGWRTFNNPSFGNQGDCVSYVEHHNGKGNDDGKGGHGHGNGGHGGGGHHGDRIGKR